MIHQSSSTTTAPLPTTIAVRNLFPPLSVCAVAAAEPTNESFHRETETCNERLDDVNDDGYSPSGGHHNGTDIAEYDDNSNDLFDIERDSAIERELNEIKEILAEAEKGSKAEADLSTVDSNNIDESDESTNGIRQDDNCNRYSYDDGDNSDSGIVREDIKSIATKALGKQSVPLGIEDRCAFVSLEVLLPLRLEIVWQKKKEQRVETMHSEDKDACETNEGKKVFLERDANEEQTIHVIYSNTMSYCTTHPRWDYLNEQLTKSSISEILAMHQKVGGSANADSKCDESNPSSSMSDAAATPAGATTKFNEPITSSSDTESFAWQKVYSDVYARIIVLSSSHKSTDGDTTTGEINERLLAEIPLHPSKLRTLSGPNDSLGTFGDDEGRRNESGNNMTIPSSLPPNAILIHYTDGHTRVLPDLYDLLIRKEIIGGDSASAAAAKGVELEEVNDQNKFVESRRFSDKAFDILGTSAEEDDRDGDGLVALKDDKDGDDGDSNLLDGRTAKNVTDSIYGNGKVFDLLGKDEDGPGSGNASLSNLTKKDSGTASNSVFDDRAFDLMEGKTQIDDHGVDEIAATIASSSISKEIATEQPTHYENGNHDSEILLSPDSAVGRVHDQKVQSSEFTNAVVPETDEQNTESFELGFDPASTVDKSSSPLISTPLTPPPSSTQLSPTSTILPPLPPLPTSSEVRLPSQKLLRVQGEVDELRRLVQKEKILLEQEQQLVLEETTRLKAIMSQVEQLNSGIEEIGRASGIERVHNFRSNFRLEAHRISLLQQLQFVFPIKLISIDIPHNIPSFASTANVSNANRTVHQYTIAGIPLPNDVHSPSVSDDQVSSALGFICHLVALASKYLGISMRYPIVCKFSRSAILDNEQRRIISGNGNGHKTTYAVYPLFRERVVEREQLDRGCELLNRNVECLLEMRNVEYRKDWNVLAKMDCLIMKLVEGEDMAFAACR